MYNNKSKKREHKSDFEGENSLKDSRIVHISKERYERLIRSVIENGTQNAQQQVDFEEVFLKEAKIKDRRQMYITGEHYEKIYEYLSVISEGKVSVAEYINNILAHHMLKFRDIINGLYKDNLSKYNPV